LVATKHPKIMLSGSRNVDWNDLQDLLVRLQAACVAREVEHVKALLKELVPEFIATEYAADKPGQGKLLH